MPRHQLKPPTEQEALIWCKAQTEGPVRYLVATTSLMLLKINETLIVSPTEGDRFLIIPNGGMCFSSWGYIGEEIADSLIKTFPQCWFISDDRDVRELERMMAL